MVSKLIAHIEKQVALSAEEKSIIESVLFTEPLKKKQFLFKAGEPCRAKYFVVEGCLRLYITNAKGVDQMIQFGIDNWWITDYLGFKNKKPSVFNLQAVNDAIIIAVDEQQMEELSGKIPKLERYFRLVLETAYGASLMRFNYVFNMSGEERYRFFSNLNPEFVQKVPQYLIASYLGVTPEFLSKIRAKKG